MTKSDMTWNELITELDRIKYLPPKKIRASDGKVLEQPWTMDRICSRVVPDVNTGCWNWVGALSKTGYGIIVTKKGTGTVHRMVWRIKYGEPGSKILVCHTCDNRKCCNPEHLFLGTVQDNSDDMVRKGRQKKSKKLTPESIVEIIKSKDLQKTIAVRFGITKSYVSAIQRRARFNYAKT
jgi:hypothetical protein